MLARFNFPSESPADIAEMVAAMTDVRIEYSCVIVRIQIQLTAQPTAIRLETTLRELGIPDGASHASIGVDVHLNGKVRLVTPS